MKINYVSGDIVADEQFDVFCQQTNCFGVMGAGLAKDIAAKYPVVKDTNRRLYKLLGADELYGTIRLIKTNDGRICANLYSQYGFGRGAIHTNYEQFQKCLDALADFCTENLDVTKRVAFPWGIGCGLAGGDWAVIEPMLQAFAEQVPQRVYIVRKPQPSFARVREACFA